MAEPKKTTRKTTAQTELEPVEIEPESAILTTVPEPVVSNICPVCELPIETPEDHHLELHRGVDLEKILNQIVNKWYAPGSWD